ncbi:MAG: hypothetical protein HKN42_12325, partial [Granulosicoccus sp.]|nr:hypothetical protein [Granulosicoccus sp.]
MARLAACRLEFLRRLLARVTVCCCLMLASPAWTAGEIEPGEALQFSDCTIGSGIAKLVAQCTTLEVPLDPESATAG